MAFFMNLKKIPGKVNSQIMDVEKSELIYGGKKSEPKLMLSIRNLSKVIAHTMDVRNLIVNTQFIDKVNTKLMEVTNLSLMAVRYWRQS